MAQTIITNTGGNYVLDGDLALDVPAGAVAAPDQVTTTPISNPPASSGYVVHRTWKVTANVVPLASLGRLHHPAVNGVDETKLRFYAATALGSQIPSAASPMPESPWMDDVVNGQTGYLPPNSGTPAGTTYVSLVQIP